MLPATRLNDSRCNPYREKKHVHLGELVRRGGVIAKTTTEEDAMHPPIMMALAEELVAERTSMRRPARGERRLRLRPRLVWFVR